jgi:hypothetical protein
MAKVLLTRDTNSFPAALPLASFSKRYRSIEDLFSSPFFYNKMERVRTLDSVLVVEQYANEAGCAPTILPES